MLTYLDLLTSLLMAFPNFVAIHVIIKFFKEAQIENAELTKGQVIWGEVAIFFLAPNSPEAKFSLKGQISGIAFIIVIIMDYIENLV